MLNQILAQDDYILIDTEFICPFDEVEYFPPHGNEPDSIEKLDYHDLLSDIGVIANDEPSLRNFYAHVVEYVIQARQAEYGPFYCWSTDDSD